MMMRSMPAWGSVNCKCSSSSKYFCTAAGNLDGVREPFVWCPVPTQMKTVSRCLVFLTLYFNCAISRFNNGIASPTCRPCKSINRCPRELLIQAFEFLHIKRQSHKNERRSQNERDTPLRQALNCKICKCQLSTLRLSRMLQIQHDRHSEIEGPRHDPSSITTTSRTFARRWPPQPYCVPLSFAHCATVPLHSILLPELCFLADMLVLPV